MKNRISILTHDAVTAGHLSHFFSKDYSVQVFNDFESYLANYQRIRSDFSFLDVEALDAQCLKQGLAETMDRVLHVYPTAHIVALARKDNVRKAFELVRLGASDYLSLPLETDELDLVTRRLSTSVKLDSELEYLRSQSWDTQSVSLIETKSPKMIEALKKMRSVSETDATVLLSGETGVGKTVFAHLLHKKSVRKNQPFISVHCGAIPEGLVESELFGHEKGAFTSAIKRKLGRFELADSGTLFLDEIATLSPSTQIKLLKVLQEGVFQRVGGEVDIRTNVRIIAASNENLENLVNEGKFRRDLYYRLNVFPVEIPPLRERVEDLPIIAHNLIGRLNRKYMKSIRGIDHKTLTLLSGYHWPGNVREFENLLERAYILEQSNELTANSFPSDIFLKTDSAVFPVNTDVPLSEARRIAQEDFEREYILRLLAKTNGSVSQTAKIAGVTSRQIHKIMHKYSLKKDEFQTSVAF